MHDDSSFSFEFTQSRYIRFCDTRSQPILQGIIQHLRNILLPQEFPQISEKMIHFFSKTESIPSIVERFAFLASSLNLPDYKDIENKLYLFTKQIKKAKFYRSDCEIDLSSYDSYYFPFILSSIQIEPTIRKLIVPETSDLSAWKILETFFHDNSTITSMSVFEKPHSSARDFSTAFARNQKSILKEFKVLNGGVYDEVFILSLYPILQSDIIENFEIKGSLTSQGFDALISAFSSVCSKLLHFHLKIVKTSIHVFCWLHYHLF